MLFVESPQCGGVKIVRHCWRRSKVCAGDAVNKGARSCVLCTTMNRVVKRTPMPRCGVVLPNSLRAVAFVEGSRKCRDKPC